ncbi:MAG TPA: hypothetical protein VFE96_02570, partial [Candidatus Bathyarchaeia archaeon]|nr:hypothetical protein [Candidatus Bathyarchaeia archaeon]
MSDSRVMKQMSSILGMHRNQTIVDVGFGQAEELDELARIVGESGRVVGIEQEKARVNKATEKLRGIPNIRVLF